MHGHKSQRRGGRHRWWPPPAVGALALLLVVMGAAAGPAEVQGPAAALQAGGHVLLIRHARAPGTGDPPGFRIGDCATQRNLDDVGRRQARQIGQWLRDRGVDAARVYSSQWCRCRETASLMDLGPVTALPALNSFFDRPEDRSGNLAALRAFLSRQPADGPLIVLVTHYVTIAAVTGEGVSSGEGVVARLGENGALTVVGRLGFGH